MARPLLQLGLAASLLLAPFAAGDGGTRYVPESQRLRLEEDGTAWRLFLDCFRGGWVQGRWEAVGDGLIRVFSVDPNLSEVSEDWEEGSATTEARVFTPEGDPLPGVVARFECAGRESVVITDAQGVARVDCIPDRATFRRFAYHDGSWELGRRSANRLRAVLAEGVPADYDELWRLEDGLPHLVGGRVSTAARPSRIEAELIPLSRLVRVEVDYNRHALAGATVTVHCERGAVETVSDHLGRAEVENCQAVAVEVSRAGFVPARHEVETEGENRFGIHLAVDLTAPDRRLFYNVDGALYTNGDAFFEAPPLEVVAP